TPDMEAVSLSMLQRGVAFATAQMDLGRTVLIHCQHGIGRSALLALCVMTARGWEPLEALERAKTRRLKVSPSPAQFEGWSRWLRAHAAVHPVSWRPPDFEAFAQIAYRHLRQG
ncbi:MAG TPA: dual specificity protein phosphatase family protein, partial [Beijerinckiaceae bacterium]